MSPPNIFSSEAGELLFYTCHLLYRHFAQSFTDISLGRYLDSEQRIVASKVIKRWIMNSKKTAFVVEHDFLMSTYLADRVIVFDGQPGIKAHANKAESLLTGCNKFLKALDVTFRVRFILSHSMVTHCHCGKERTRHRMTRH